jgi:hypothetical protein
MARSFVGVAREQWLDEAPIDARADGRCGFITGPNASAVAFWELDLLGNWAGGIGEAFVSVFRENLLIR